MRLTFTSGDDGVMSLTPGSKRALDNESAIIAADFARDMLVDTFDTYNFARARLGWSAVSSFAPQDGTPTDL